MTRTPTNDISFPKSFLGVTKIFFAMALHTFYARLSELSIEKIIEMFVLFVQILENWSINESLNVKME